MNIFPLLLLYDKSNDNVIDKKEITIAQLERSLPDGTNSQNLCSIGKIVDVILFSMYSHPIRYHIQLFLISGYEKRPDLNGL